MSVTAIAASSSAARFRILSLWIAWCQLFATSCGIVTCPDEGRQ
jgi:hypothetical protein